MTRHPRIAAHLLLQSLIWALPVPLAGAAQSPVNPGLATCRAGMELRKKTKRVRVTVRDKNRRKRRVWRRKVRWACIKDVRAPRRVIGLTAVPGDGMVALAWKASEDNGGIAGYEIYRDGRYVVTINSTEFKDPSLVNGVAHQYRVRAVDMARNLSAPSGIVWATPRLLPDVTAPGMPIGLTATADPASLTVNLAWVAPADNKGVVSYRIFRDGELAGTSTAPSFADPDRNHKTEYRYSVIALDAAGNMSAQTPAVATYVS